MILAVDTSLGTSVAVVNAESVRTASSPNALGHAEVIGDLLADVLSVKGDITHVVAGMGPGPFTGLRIGIATARAFAAGRSLPVIPVPSHLALALTEIESGAKDRFAIVTDARRREVAITIFEGLDADGIPAVVTDTRLVLRVDAETALGGVRAVEVSQLDAAALGRVGQRALQTGRTLTGTEPIYLRQPDVTLPGAPKKVSA